MEIRGFYKFSLVDYPGKIAAVLFTGACNLRCSFCHNACLVLDPESQPRLLEREIFNYLQKRRGLLEGLVISGGEPMLQPDLAEFIHRVHELGFRVKLDTNGTYPERLEALLAGEGVEALGIDYKASAAAYPAVTNVPAADLAEKVQRSLRLALSRPEIELDIRTTVHQFLQPPEMLETMARELADCGVRLWTLQQFNPVEIMDDDLRPRPTYTDLELGKLARELAPVLGGTVRVRGLSGRIL